MNAHSRETEPLTVGRLLAPTAWVERLVHGRDVTLSTSDPEGPHEPELMTSALRNLLDQPLPSSRHAPEMLNGLSVITDLVADRVGRPLRRRAVAAQR